MSRIRNIRGNPRETPAADSAAGTYRRPISQSAQKPADTVLPPQWGILGQQALEAGEYRLLIAAAV
jgi:hypothetical protein